MLNVVIQIRATEPVVVTLLVVRNKSIPVPGLRKPLLKRLARTRSLTKIYTSFPSERQTVRHGSLLSAENELVNDISFKGRGEVLI